MYTNRLSLCECGAPRHATQQTMRRNSVIRLAIGLVLALSLKSGMADEVIAPAVHPFDCSYKSAEQVQAALRAAVIAGEIQDPARKPLPTVAPRRRPPDASRAGGASTMIPADIFPFEDSNSVLLSNFSNGQMFSLMIDATNAVLSSHGDNFDFVAFFINFVPHHQIGGAFYAGVENNVSGIGLSIFNNRAANGVAGDHVEGWVMMWNQANWPLGPNTITQLVFGQEFEHRFGVFINGMPGRPFQGNNGSCGRGAHWNFAVDAQGSGMEIAEWVGTSPANRIGGNLNFNSDIGGVFSHPDLYLMGYVSGDEMDSLSSELRYIDDNASCSSPHNGPISNWSSTDIVAANGPRVPDSLAAQKNFNTAWVMIHLPGSPPTESQLDRVVSMLNDWSDVWASSTLGRGSMNNTLLVNPPLPVESGTPNDRLKNRYISLRPNNRGRITKLEVTLTAGLPHPALIGDSWWVRSPVETAAGRFPKPLVGDGECVAFLGSESTAAEMDWDGAGCRILHITGCPIEPTSAYDVRAVTETDTSVALNVPTALQPGGGKFWGDAVGFFDGVEWTAAQGTVNIDDASVAISTFQGGQVVAPTPGSQVAHLSVADVEPGNVNTVVNFADVLILLNAFRGDTYPFGPADGDGNCP